MCGNAWQDVARCDDILKRLGTELKVVVEITFL